MWLKVAGILTAILLIYLLFGPAFAQSRYVVQNDYGGSMQEYQDRYLILDQSGGHIRVAGECVSSCTLMLAHMDYEHVCVDAQAWFGFHSASSVNDLTRERKHSPEATRYMWQLYPMHVQNMLRLRGWNGADGAEHPELIMIRASAFYRVCTD